MESNIVDNETFKLSEKVFQNREDLLDEVRSFYLKQGYVTVIRKSKKDKEVRIGCDRGGCYDNRQNAPLELRKRKSSSRLINCPFEILGKKLRDDTWTVKLINGSHNHEASQDMSGHPYCRRLSNNEIQIVGEMSKSGVQPRQILSSLRQRNPGLQAISRTIHNTTRKIQHANLGGRTPIQALFEEFGEGEFLYNFKHGDSGHLTHLFFAHPASITLTRSFSNVFVMDCTYKTNRYKMPLLNIIGVSCFNTSFYSCFTFMEREREEDYIWALNMFVKVLGPKCQVSVIITDRELALMNAIKKVFPNVVNLLCVWHIEKNILSNCKRYFAEQEDWNAFLSSWNTVIKSYSETDFERNWKLFEEQYKDKEVALAYIQKTWIILKEHFVSVWTEKYLHFGNRVSSRAEGAHAKLKRYLQDSKGGFHRVKEKICLAIENEFQEIKAQLSSEKIRILHSCKATFFRGLVTKVSIHALKELQKQYDMVRYGTMEALCTGHFMSSMGLPCAHKMLACKESELPLSTIHPQWRIDIVSLACINERGSDDDDFKELFSVFQNQFQKWPLVQQERAQLTISQLIQPSLPSVEPIVSSKTGLSQGSKRRKESTSTKRDPSRFEIEEKRRKCSVCQSTDHDIRRCPKKFENNEQATCSIPKLFGDGNMMTTIDLNMTYDQDFISLLD